jgi:hypothetical protein
MQVKNIEGKETDLKQYAGNVSLVINVACFCGYTKSSYPAVQKLYDKYQSKGFTGVFGFARVLLVGCVLRPLTFSHFVCLTVAMGFPYARFPPPPVVSPLLSPFFFIPRRVYVRRCNQFGGQEPGTEQEIQETAKKLGVTFPL